MLLWWTGRGTAPRVQSIVLFPSYSLNLQYIFICNSCQVHLVLPTRIELVSIHYQCIILPLYYRSVDFAKASQCKMSCLCQSVKHILGQFRIIFSTTRTTTPFITIGLSPIITGGKQWFWFSRFRRFRLFGICTVRLIIVLHTYTTRQPAIELTQIDKIARKTRP